MEPTILYLVLMIKPRFDDTNIVEQYPTKQQCQVIADELNLLYNQTTTEPKYAWVCKELAGVAQ